MSKLKKKLLNHERNNKIRFYENEHEYYFYPSGDFRKTKERVQYSGITGWIGQYASKFDADAIAKSCNKNPNSEYYQMGEGAIKEQWRQQRIKGDNIHKVIEESINLDGLYDEEFSFYLDQFWDIMFDNNLKPFRSEFVVYDEDIERATPIDVLATNEDETKIIPLDIKTYRKGLTFTGYGNKRLKHPLTDLYESKFSKVSLQVSIARKWLIDKYDFEEDEVDYGKVVLLNDDGAQMYPTLNYNKYVNKMYTYE